MVPGFIVAGVEAERTATDDANSNARGISLLAYFQDTVRRDWRSHGDQHDLEDRALNLALARVADNTASLDRALQLAVAHVDEAHSALRDLLSQRVDGLTDVVEANEANGILRVEQARRSVENLKNSEHQAIREYIEALRLELTQNIEAYRESAASMSEAQLSMLERLTMQELESHKHTHAMEQKAIEVAKQGQDTRLESMNEFRTQLREQAATFPTRDYVDTLMKPIVDRLGSLEKNASDVITRSILDGRINPLETARANQAGSERALTAMFAVLIFIVPLALHYLLPR